MASSVECGSLSRVSKQERSWAKREWYRGLHFACRLGAIVLYRARCTGRHHVPSTGGVLLLSNHQSLFDPVIVGLACDRRTNYLARASLFRFLPFRLLIESLDAIPIDRDGVGLAGLKETLRRLKREEMVLIFPEGTRSSDGEIQPLKPGFLALARRGKVPLVPIAFDGAFQAWPRTRWWPGLGTWEVDIGEPIWPELVGQLDDEALLAEVEQRIRACHARARERRSRRMGRLGCRPAAQAN